MRFVLLILLGLAACGVTPPPVAHGPFHQINVGRWSYNYNNLTTMPPGFVR